MKHADSMSRVNYPWCMTEIIAPSTLRECGVIHPYLVFDISNLPQFGTGHILYALTVAG